MGNEKLGWNDQSDRMCDTSSQFKFNIMSK